MPSDIQYEMLRAEAIERIRMRQAVILGLMLFFATLSGFTLDKHPLLIFVYPPASLVVMLVWAQHHIRIGILANFIDETYETDEPDAEFGWERYMAKHRSKIPHIFRNVQRTHGGAVLLTQLLVIAVAVIARTKAENGANVTTLLGEALQQTDIISGAFLTIACMAGTVLIGSLSSFR